MRKRPETTARLQLVHYLLIILVVISLGIGISTLTMIQDIKKTLPRTIDIEDFLARLTAQENMQAFVGVAPLNIIEINNNNFANLQAQITDLDTSYLGSFLVQYTNAIVVYDYFNNEIKGVVTLQQPQQSQLPTDFFEKLYTHPQTNGLEGEQPIGGQLDGPTLATLQEQFPQIYNQAEVGDYLLRFQTRLIVYDYTNDAVVVAVNLQ